MHPGGWGLHLQHRSTPHWPCRPALLPEAEGRAVGSGRLDEGILLSQTEQVEISEKNHELRAMAASSRARNIFIWKPRWDKRKEACQAENPTPQLPESALYLQASITGTGFPGLLITTGWLFSLLFDLNYDSISAFDSSVFLFCILGCLRRFHSKKLFMALKKSESNLFFSYSWRNSWPIISPLHRCQGLMVESPFPWRLPSSSISGEGVIRNVFITSRPPTPPSFCPWTYPSVCPCNNKHLWSTFVRQPQP